MIIAFDDLCLANREKTRSDELINLMPSPNDPSNTIERIHRALESIACSPSKKSLDAAIDTIAKLHERDFLDPIAKKLLAEIISNKKN